MPSEVIPMKIMNTSILCSVLIVLFLSLAVSAHSTMTQPSGLTGAVCRQGDKSLRNKRYCEGPCNLRNLRVTDAEVSQIRRGIDIFAKRTSQLPRALFYPPNKPAATYKRGQTITVKYTRNNHGPGGFERYTLVPLRFNWMNKAVHSKLAIHFSCWGENPKTAAPNELEKSKFGVSLVGTDGRAHKFPKGYYVTRLTIPEVVPDGKYILGWSWYGGCFNSVKGNTPQEPGTTSGFTDFWSCSFIEVRGGKPLVKEYKPVFFGSRFATPRGSACRSGSDSLGHCRKEPCKKKCEYMKPKEFQGDGPRTLTPVDFGYMGKDESSTPMPNSKGTKMHAKKKQKKGALGKVFSYCSFIYCLLCKNNPNWKMCNSDHVTKLCKNIDGL